MGKKDELCDLQCVKTSDRPGKHEFVGPVKIVIEDTPPAEYLRREWVAALVMAAYFIMGSIIMITTCYTLLWWKSISNHLHVWLATSSMAFFTPTAILFYNRLSGTGGVLDPADRKQAHWILHVISFSWMALGALAIKYVKRLNYLDTHTFISLAAICGVFINMILGIIMSTDRKTLLAKIPPTRVKWSHRLLGVVTMAACSASFITGLFMIGPIFTHDKPHPDLPAFLTTLFIPLMGLRYYVSFLSMFGNGLTIRIIDRPNYWRSVFCALGVGMSHLFIGATNMVALIYALKMENPHVALCCISFHLFSAEAILALNYVNFWAVTLRLKHRIMVHIVLQLLAFVTGVVGTTMVMIARGLPPTLHTVSSAIAVGLATLTLFLGVGVLTMTTSEYCRPVHVCFGLLTFVAASISLLTGISTQHFMATFDPYVLYTLIGFIVFYTTYICIASFLKCISRL